MKAVMSGSPSLARAAPELSAAASLGGIDVISVRLWLDRTVATRSPANVFSKFEGLQGAGGTFFMLDLLPSAVPAFKEAKVVDSFVAKYPGAVTWFSPGSFKKRPPLETKVGNLVCAGDWVRMGDREHGAKGLCQERAYVSGFEAANSLARRGLLGEGHRQERKVLPVREDELQVKAGRAAFRAFAK